MTMFATVNARHTARLARQYAALATALDARGDHLGAFSASLRSARLRQVSEAWSVVA